MSEPSGSSHVTEKAPTAPSLCSEHAKKAKAANPSVWFRTRPTCRLDGPWQEQAASGEGGADPAQTASEVPPGRRMWFLERSETTACARAGRTGESTGRSALGAPRNHTHDELRIQEPRSRPNRK